MDGGSVDIAGASIDPGVLTIAVLLLAVYCPSMDIKKAPSNGWGFFVSRAEREGIVETIDYFLTAA